MIYFPLNLLLLAGFWTLYGKWSDFSADKMLSNEKINKLLMITVAASFMVSLIVFIFMNPRALAKSAAIDKAPKTPDAGVYLGVVTHKIQSVTRDGSSYDVTVKSTWSSNYNVIMSETKTYEVPYDSSGLRTGAYLLFIASACGGYLFYINKYSY